MMNVCWMLSRLCLAAWVGVAQFFFVLLVSLRGSELFTPETKLNHPKVLFPLFYRFEFWMLGLALGCGLLAARGGLASRWRTGLYLSLVALGLLLAIGDYSLIYRPLAAMIELPTLPANFASYHEWSRWLNVAALVCCTAAAMTGLWPARAGTERLAP